MAEDINTDYCIAGAGIAGAVLASKLAASGKRIVLLEQGPRFTEEDRHNMLQQDDLRVKTLYGYGRDWPITYDELEPWLLRAEHQIGVSGNDDNPYASPRSGAFPMPAHLFSYFDREILGPTLKSLNMIGHSCPRAINSEPFRGRSACVACRICKFCPSGARYSPDRAGKALCPGDGRRSNSSNALSLG